MQSWFSAQNINIWATFLPYINEVSNRLNKSAFIVWQLYTEVFIDNKHYRRLMSERSVQNKSYNWLTDKDGLCENTLIGGRLWRKQSCSGTRRNVSNIEWRSENILS